jgi:hypothetical protein
MSEDEVENFATEKDDPLAKYTLQLAQYTKWLMLATFLTMLCTSWIAWSTQELSNFSEQQAKDMNVSLRMTTSAIFAANRQAVAMEKANELANETSRNQLRAYVSISSIETEKILKKDMRSIVHYKNAGVTPAIDLRVFGSSAIVSSPGKEPPHSYAKLYSGSGDPSSVLGAGLDTSDLLVREGSSPFNEEELQQFQTGQKKYVVWGTVYYSDVFRKDHYVRFCKIFEKGELSRWSSLCGDNDAD